MAKPRPTKSSLQRQNLALAKRMETLCLVPDEVLFCVFKYISISDLLRCCCVSKTWKDVANIQSLWEVQFKRLPKHVRDLSEKAKTTGSVNWKEECLLCSKERRKRWIRKLCKDNNKGVYNKKKQKVSFIRSLHIRWLLIFKDCSSKHYEVITAEDYIFNIGMSVRWNELDIPPLSKIVSVRLYALTPLFFDADLKPYNDNIYTRSLLLVHSFKDSPLPSLKKLCEDDHVSIHVLKEYLYFGLWKSSLPKIGDVAFIGMCAPLKGLLELTQQGSSQSIFQMPKHCVVPDDVDTKYGLRGYFAEIEIRNTRKSFFYELYKEFDEGIWEGDILCIVQQRYEDYVFYDIKEKIVFTWKTLALKGSIEDFLILDANLYDSNQHLMWSFSSPINLMKCRTEKDNYSYEHGELWTIEKVEDCGKCLIELMKNTDTNESTILAVKFRLTKCFVNEWFGTSY